MAITPLTGFKAFEFDGEASTDYGVQILGSGVFDAPKREVEMIKVPGRNGEFALDQGRFENIEVTYPANIIASSTADFAEAVSDLRNMLCSRKGYCVLTDDYNPGEYRLAVYKSGLEVDEKVLRAGEFDITFDCKPQRYLTSGETAISVSDGQTIDNPTLFEASPLLEFDGYGSIGINGETVTVSNGDLGEIQLSTAVRTASARLDVTNLNIGDTIINRASSLPSVKLSITADWGSLSSPAQIRYISGGTATIIQPTQTMFTLTLIPTVTSFTNGTSSTVTMTMTIDIPGNNYTMYEQFEVAVAYDAVARTISLVPRFVNGQPSSVTCTYKYEHPAYYGISTKVVRPSPMYIDLDIGQAYGVMNNEIASFNSIVTMQAKLPTLKAGSNMITFDSTISDMKITPRWWKI
jgi:phage-related protein